MQQGTKEWHEWRKDKIGASDTPSILGVGYHTPRQLWEIKKGFRIVEMNPAMMAGKRLEEQVRRWYETTTGHIMWPCCVTHSEHEWMIASFDGLTDDCERGLEIKVLGREKHTQVKNGTIPECYYPQVQHQCAVGPRVIDFVSYNEAADDYAIVTVERNDEYIAEIMPKLREFHTMLINGNPPNITDKDRVMRDDEEFRCALKRLSICKDKLDEAKAKHDNARKSLLDICDQSCEGFGYSVTKTAVKGRVDYEKIPELAHIDTAAYRKKDTIQWNIRKKKNGNDTDLVSS